MPGGKGYKNKGEIAGIPRNQRAYLMYYLHCVCSILEIDKDKNINKLRQFRRYKDLTPKQIDQLIAVCMLMSPDRLQDKYIFHNDSMCEDRSNRFLETSIAEKELDVDDSLIDVDGETKRCAEVMAFKMNWIDLYWTKPMLAVVKERQRQLNLERFQSSSCTIL